MRTGRIDGLDADIPRIVTGCARADLTNELLDELVETGATAFDTARVYAGSEAALGRWMSARGNRDALTIISKGSHPAPDGTRRLDARSMRDDLDVSLGELGIDTIDLWFLHRDDESTPVEAIIVPLNELVASGRIRAFGASNWSTARLQAANDFAAANGLEGFAASSPHFGLAEYVVDPWGGCLSIAGPDAAEARDWYRETGMPVFAWSSLGSGYLSGRVRSGEPASLAALGADAATAFAHPVNEVKLARLEAMASEKGCSVSQLALAWIFANRLDVFAIASAGSGARMRENIAALEIELTEAEARFLDTGEA